MENELAPEKIIQLLENQLDHSNEQVQKLTKQIESLTQQVQNLTKLLYGSKTEKSKYNAPDGQDSLFDDDPSFNDSEHTEEQSTTTITYTVVRKQSNKKRNDSFGDGIEIEEIHHHPENKQCDCCQSQMVVAGMTIAREEAKFIPATMKRIQHIEHAYECKHCKKNAAQKAQIKRGKAPQAVTQRSIAGPTIVLFQSSLSRSRSVLEDFIVKFKGTIICDGYSAYGKLPPVTFANCWAYVRRYWLKADSKNGQIGVDYCDRLYRLERQFKHLLPGKRRKARPKYSKPIIEEFLKWVDEAPFFGKSALAKAAEYTLNRATELQAFLHDGRIEIDNNPAENAIRPNVIGRKNWLFSVSEAGAKANSVCLSLAETTKANGIDFYQYLVKLFTDLPNLQIHQRPEILRNYMP